MTGFSRFRSASLPCSDSHREARHGLNRGLMTPTASPPSAQTGGHEKLAQIIGWPPTICSSHGGAHDSVCQALQATLRAVCGTTAEAVDYGWQVNRSSGYAESRRESRV